MTPERWRQITEIFHAARERDPARREAFVAEACRDDPALRREVEAMLLGLETPARFGEIPLFPSPHGPIRRPRRRQPAGPWLATGAVSDSRPPGSWRHGPGLQGFRSSAPPRDRHQDRRGALQRAIRARGSSNRDAESSQHLHHPRRRPQLPGDGAGGRRNAAGLVQARAPHRAQPRDRPAGARGAPRRASCRHRPSRLEARKRHGPL